MVYQVTLVQEDRTSEFVFKEFTDAKRFASAAERMFAITKIGITNNESPEYLTLWKKGP